MKKRRSVRLQKRETTRVSAVWRPLLETREKWRTPSYFDSMLKGEPERISR